VTVVFSQRPLHAYMAWYNLMFEVRLQGRLSRNLNSGKILFGPVGHVYLYIWNKIIYTSSLWDSLTHRTGNGDTFNWYEKCYVMCVITHNLSWIYCHLSQSVCEDSGIFACSKSRTVSPHFSSS
jgi:hypothetical protein